MSTGSGTGGSSQIQPQNLASASANTASSLLYSGGGSSRPGPGLISRGVDKDSRPTVSSRYGSSVTSNGSATGSGHVNGSSVTGTGAGTNSSATSSYSNGSSLTGAGSYSSNNYRLASMDRLANRQKLYDTGTGGDATSGGPNKRELFFRNDNSPAPSLVTTVNTSAPPPGSLGALKSEPLKGTNTLNSVEDNREKELKESKLSAEDKSQKKELDGYVGFVNFPNQVFRKSVQKGFEFTVMVVGASGLGKSTLMNSMFLADIYSAEYPGPSHRIKKTVQVETCKVLLSEKGVNLTLTVVDTPGFGDGVDNSNCWQPVLDYVENRYEDYLNAESRVNRKVVNDSRVHCCLYFISPGHGLKALDIEFMSKLHDKVNIVPVIAKADTLTPEECALFKKTVLNEIAKNKIRIYEIYEIPDCDEDENEKTTKGMRERVPFAVVGSNTIVDVDGRKVRGRKYPWGTVLVESLEHCDFLTLRKMILRTHLQDLKDVTNSIHYENFRCRRLGGVGPDGKPIRGTKNPLAQMEEEKKSHDDRMKKMEKEMEHVFDMKVQERNQRLLNSENDLLEREQGLKKSIQKLQKEYDERKKQFEVDKAMWEQANGMTYEELRRRGLEALSKETACTGKGSTLFNLRSSKVSKEDLNAASSTLSTKSKTSGISLQRSKSMPKQNRTTSLRGQECAPT